MALSSKDDPVYSFYLTFITIDMSHTMEIDKTMGRGWRKLPKNKTNVKIKILEQLLAMENNGFCLIKVKSSGLSPMCEVVFVLRQLFIITTEYTYSVL